MHLNHQLNSNVNQKCLEKPHKNLMSNPKESQKSQTIIKHPKIQKKNQVIHRKKNSKLKSKETPTKSHKNP